MVGDECWLWQGYCNRDGYGWASTGGKKVFVHRAVYEVIIGPIPEGFTLDHVVCQIRNCYNPWHMEPVTQSVNAQRGNSTRVYPHATHCAYGHERIPENLGKPRANGKQDCRICVNRRARESRVSKVVV